MCAVKGDVAAHRTATAYSIVIQNKHSGISAAVAQFPPHFCGAEEARGAFRVLENT